MPQGLALSNQEVIDLTSKEKMIINYQFFKSFTINIFTDIFYSFISSFHFFHSFIRYLLKESLC